MLRSLIVLAALAGVAWLVRPLGRTSQAGIVGWHWLGLGVAVQVLWVRQLSVQAAAPSVLHWLPSLALLPALWFVWLNRRYAGLWLLAAGAGLNLLVMISNGGLMPIAPTSLHALGPSAPYGAQGTAVALSKDRVLGDSAAHLAMLDDRLIYQVGGLHIACSAGDLLVVAGCLLAVGEELWRGSRTRPSRPSHAHDQGVLAAGETARPAA